MRSLSHRDGRDRPVMERLDTRRVSPSARLFRALFLRLPRPLPLLGDRRLRCPSRVSSLFFDPQRLVRPQGYYQNLQPILMHPRSPYAAAIANTRARADSVSRKREEERRRRWRLDCRGFPVPGADPREEGRRNRRVTRGKKEWNWRELMLPRLIRCIPRLIGEGGDAYSEQQKGVR